MDGLNIERKGESTATMKSVEMSKRFRGSTSTGPSELPLEIIVIILSCLPVKSLLTCKQVCKLWLFLISHPRFIESHLEIAKEIRSGYLMKENNHSMFMSNSLKKFQRTWFLQGKEEPAQINELNIQPVTDRTDSYYSIMDSCNGLVCLARSDVLDTIHICNPATGDHTTPPRPSPYRTYDLAFAYDEINNAYKLFRIYFTGPLLQSIYQVFTLGSRSWRHKGIVPFIRNETKHVQAGGAIHWLLYKHMGQPTGILSIDIETEDYRIHHNLPSSENGENTYLIDLNQSVAVCMINKVGMEVWIQRETDDSTYYWEKMYGFNMPKPVTRALLRMTIPPTTVRDHEILLARGTDLVFFNMAIQASRTVHTSRKGKRLDLTVLDHFESLVPCKQFHWTVEQCPEIKEILESFFSNSSEDDSE